MNKTRSTTICLVLFWLLSIVLLPLPTFADTKQSFALARAPYTFHFPRDHAAHAAYRTEWWYYTGNLVATDGRQFGFELTFFRIGLAPGDPPPKSGQSRWRGNEIYPAHFAISDITGQQFFSDERLAREALGQGGADEKKLAVHAFDWTLRLRADGAMVLHAVSGGHALDLVLIAEKPPAIHGNGGITKKGACLGCASHYYSFTRMRADGRLAIDHQPIVVHGQAWMDHEYASSQLERDQVGWDWFSFQFNDRREVMYYRLRTKQGKTSPQSSGSLISVNGRVQLLRKDDMQCHVLTQWTSAKTNAVYPSSWQCRIPKAGLAFSVVPRLLDQELTGSTIASPAYWEGDVSLQSAGHEIGTGYVELTGYATPISL